MHLRNIVPAVAAAAFMAGAAHAAPITTINGLDFDLAQFAGAAVTTTVGTGSIFGSTFDNENGIDGVTLGELATGQFGSDPGDRITLGLGNTGRVDSLTLTYAASVLVGTGDSAKFVIFEQSGDTNLDAEGQSFEISVNGGTFVNAVTSSSVTAIGGVAGGGGTLQNMIIFDLLNADFGLSVGNAITTVTLRNLGLTSSEDDPDFLFAGLAGPLAAVPVPAALPLVATGFGLFGLLGWRRSRRAA